MTVEPFGKDHSSRGGSYDTGKRIMREVYSGEPPYPIPYEWLGLRGQGDMSSSKGNLVSMFDLTQTIPPEVARYMIFRVKPTRRITFDPGLPLLNLVDEYDNAPGELSGTLCRRGRQTPVRHPLPLRAPCQLC